MKGYRWTYLNPIPGKRVGVLVLRKSSAIIAACALKWESSNPKDYTLLCMPKQPEYDRDAFMKKSAYKLKVEQHDWPKNKTQIKKIVEMMVMTGVIKEYV